MSRRIAPLASVAFVLAGSAVAATSVTSAAAGTAVPALLGEPSDDTEWVDPRTVSTCPGTQLRRVSWAAVTLFFGDESSLADDVSAEDTLAADTPQLFAYSYGRVDDLAAEPVGLSTSEGIGLGSSVAYLRAAYPDSGDACGV